MARYQAELPAVPLIKNDDVEALCGMGGVRIIFTCEFKNRRTAIRELNDEYEWMGYPAEFWEKALVAVRGKRGAPWYLPERNSDD
jgi:hypothetical protein